MAIFGIGGWAPYFAKRGSRMPKDTTADGGRPARIDAMVDGDSLCVYVPGSKDWPVGTTAGENGKKE